MHIYFGHVRDAATLDGSVRAIADQGQNFHFRTKKSQFFIFSMYN